MPRRKTLPPSQKLRRTSRTCALRALIDDTFLAGEGISDFDQYRVDPSQPLQVDFFVPDEMRPPAGVSLDRLG